MSEVIFSEKAPKPVGPYSQAVQSGNFLFLAGQIPLDPHTSQMVEGGVAEQTIRVLENIKGVLSTRNADLTNIVKTTVFLKDLNDFAAMNEVYAKYFPEMPPARSTIEVSKLPLDSLVEIEVVAEVL